MGFQLTIAEGKEAGREFVFEQASVVIGRTSDCDVVLYDPGVSRRHARVFAEGENYFVEDLGSSNGTKVNAALVKKQQLNENDRITLGPVIFTFVPTTLDTAVDGPLGEEDDGSTRIVSVDSVKRQKNKGVALVPQNAQPDQLQQLGRSQTKAMAAVSRPRTSSAVARALVPPPEVAEVPRPTLSAAERARIRRQSSGAGASARIFWAEADAKKRGAIYAVAAVVVLGVLGGISWLVLSEDNGGPREAEVTELSGRPLEQSFGVHPRAQFERIDAKEFTFSFTSAVRTVAILHYQSEEISQGEVMINVNGTDLQPLVPDTLGSSERSHELVIPADLVKKGVENKVIFDNTRNPPGEEQWRIWNVWLEFVPLPELPPEQLLREAQANYERGKTNLERIDIGARNRYDAWKELRQAWLLLETNPELNRDLHDLSRFMMEKAQLELDRKCAQLLRDVDRYANMNQWEQARSALDHVKAFFPGTDQPCPYTAEQRRAQYDLP